MTDKTLTDDVLTNARIRVPDHVASREFEAETVILNLSTGQYHGLNPTGGRMLELLRDTGSVTQTAEAVAQQYRSPVDEVMTDVVELCRSLAERGLLEVDTADE